MTLDLSELFVIGIGYLLLLFLIAWATDRGWLPAALVRHPAVYVLSLGVYASAWAVYGAVGFAFHHGYNFLAFYVGISGVFLLAPILLAPILRLSQTYQLGSLADLFAYRYRSAAAGGLVTVFMLLGVLPLLALQIQAVADSIHILTGEPSRNSLAFWFCVTIVAFAILFGARHITPREKHEGLVVAIAVESLVKLAALGAAALFSVFVVFDGPNDLHTWLREHPETLTMLYAPLADGTWHSLILAFFVSAVVMPHMYHMAFTENINPRALMTASWGLPLLLLAMSLAVPFILWGAMKTMPGTDPEYFSLGTPMALGSSPMAIVVYIGGLSAASGVIIVSTLALAGMCLNHLALPLYKPGQSRDLYRWLLWTKRVLIAAIIVGAYLFYYFLNNRNTLTELGMLAFVATLQFVPGLIGVLFWPAANRAGFIAGLVTGFTVWFFALLLPTITPVAGFAIPVLGIDFQPNATNWHTAAFTAIILNGLVGGLVSMATSRSDAEQRAAETCAVDNLRRPYRWKLGATSVDDFFKALTGPLGAATARREVEFALRDLGLEQDESRPYMLRRLRDQIETNLSGLLGPSVAHEIVDDVLPYKPLAEGSGAEDIHFIESRLEDYQFRLSGLAAELDNLRRFHRQTLHDLPLGVCSLGTDREILGWNAVMESLTGIRASDIIGSHLHNLPEPWRKLLADFAASNAQHIHQKPVTFAGSTRWLSLHKAAINLPSGQSQLGAQVLVLEDLTDMKTLEGRLAHNERLASIGRLAAGVAHEIGNPVTGIACLAQDLQSESENTGVRDYTRQILEQTRRIDRIVQSLVSFSHSGRQSTTMEPVNIRQTVEEAIALFRLGRDARDVPVHNECSPDLRVSGDGQRLLQVFINLLNNAHDARNPDTTPADPIRVYTQLRDPFAVTVCVEDNGTGIPPELLGKVFEPFVTTKEPGKGTGLGLSLVYSIVEDHQGHIAIESPVRDGRGTRIVITLPRRPDAADRPAQEQRA
ncbi:MAG: ATP-binding protein [Pseudomonadota bacterium]